MNTLIQIGLACLFFAQLSLGGFAQSRIITTYAGNGTPGFSGDGDPATAASVWGPTGVALDSSGNLYIADQGNNRIRIVSPTGVMHTFAGNGLPFFSGDGGPATAARLWGPTGVALDSSGRLYIADQGNNRIRIVSPTGVMHTFAGNGRRGFIGDGHLATMAQVSEPSGVAIDSDRNLYIADQGNNRIRKVTMEWTISTVAGGGTSGLGDGGAATAAQLKAPYGVAVDSAGNLYIADTSNHRIRMVTTAGVISTVAGNGTGGFSGDGGPATAARLSEPCGVAVDFGGNLYIADHGNNRIRKVTAQVMTVSFSDIFFPQVVVGGGYSIVFTITNTGATAASGNLILTDQQGNPLTVSGTLTDSFGVTQPASVDSIFALTIPSGGTIFLSAAGATTSSPTKVGWGQLDSLGGSLSAVAIYEYAVGSVTQALVGVLQSQPLQYATIPVDNSRSPGKQLAYAIANPSSQTIAVKLALIGQDGTVVDDTVTITLGPGQQIARYLWQDLARTNFKGSLVLQGQAGATFVVVAFVEKQGLLTAIPVISEKAPGVPN